MLQNINFKKGYSLPNKETKREGVQKTISKSSQAVSDRFEDNSAVKAISSSAGDGGFAKAAPLVPVLFVADKLIDNSMAGSNKTNILGKLAKLGDKISDFLHLEKFISGEKIRAFKEKLAKNRFTKYFTKSYKANPICSMAKTSSLAETLSGKLDEQAQKVLPRIMDLGKTPEVVSALRTSSTVKPETISIVNDVIAGAEKTFSTKQIIDAVDDLAKNHVNVGGNALSVARNKLAAANSQVGNTTLGKTFSKGFVKTKDVITYGGGLISLFFMASSLMNAIKATKEAPKGEKKATFMHVLSEQYLGMILFQPSINLVYKAAGNKYRGMSETGRKALADLVKNTSIDETLTKEAVKVAKLQKKLLLKGVDESKVAALAGKTLKDAKIAAQALKGEGAKLKFWEKPLKFIGSLFGTGLDKIKAPKYGEILGKKTKIPQPTLKGFIGGLGRFALIMFVVQPLLQKPLTKLCHKIFGKPKSYLEKQKAKEAPNPREFSQNPYFVQPVDQSVMPVQTPMNLSETNLLKKFASNPNPDSVNTVNNTSQVQAVVGAQPVVSSSTSDSLQINPHKSQPIAVHSISGSSSERYIPSVDKPYIPTDNSQQIEERVRGIIKSTNSLVNRAKKTLN